MPVEDSPSEPLLGREIGRRISLRFVGRRLDRLELLDDMLQRIRVSVED